MTAREKVQRLAQLARPATPAAAPPESLLQPLSDVTPLAVDWLWPGRVPFGMLTMLDGDPGLGKSSVAFDLAARLTRGFSMPLGRAPVGPPAGVLLLCAEDSAAYTLRPRLEAIGADLGRVFTLKCAVSLPADVATVEATARAGGVRLVVIDPVMSFLSAGVDSNGDQSARQALTPLKGMAERTGAAVVLIRHLNKKTGSSAAYRGGGSIAFNAAARSALVVGRCPAGGLVLASTKCNVGPRPDALAYAVADAPCELPGGGSVRMPVVHWGEVRPDLSADDIVTRPEAREAEPANPKRDAAREWLVAELAGSEVAKSELELLAAEAGLAWRTVERAAEELGVRKSRAGFAGGGSGWSLPPG